MLNYIKSEFYRVLKQKNLYGFAGLLIVLSLLLHGSLYFLSPRYATTSFSYSNLVANPMIFGFMGMCIAFLLYEDNKKNGALKNSVAFGLSRSHIFLGESIVAIVSATAVMIIVMAAWIFSAVVLLEPTGPVELRTLLTEILAVFFIACAVTVSAILCIELIEKTIAGILACLGFWFLLPRTVYYLGFKSPVIHKIAMAFPDNLFWINRENVNLGKCITVWDTSLGMALCLITGAAWLIVFLIWGTFALRKRDL